MLCCLTQSVASTMNLLLRNIHFILQESARYNRKKNTNTQCNQNNKLNTETQLLITICLNLSVTDTTSRLGKILYSVSTHAHFTVLLLINLNYYSYVSIIIPIILMSTIGYTCSVSHTESLRAGRDLDVIHCDQVKKEVNSEGFLSI